MTGLSIELRVLGPMQLGPDDGPVGLGGVKQRGVLALLTLEFGRAVSSDALIEAVWRHDRLPDQPRRALQVYVSNLRKLLRPHSIDIVGTGRDYRLGAVSDRIDLWRFEELVTRGGELRASRPAEATTLMRAAEALWRGRPFLGIDIDELDRAAERLDGLRLDVMESCLGEDVLGPDRPRALAALRRIVDEHPAREQAAAHLATGLYLDQRQSEALDVLRAVRSRLLEFGLEPSPVIGELELEILRHEVQRPAATAPPRLNDQAAASIGMPRLVSSFVGRGRELSVLVDQVAAIPWVTLTGPGGVGKTRLAVETAATTDRLGIFVGLAATDADGVVPAIVAAAGLPISPGSRTDELVAAFRNRFAGADVLLVIDNAEHVVEKVVEVGTALIHHVDRLHLLVTSRDRLGVPGESTVAVEPMSDDDSLRLFAERAGLGGYRIDLESPEVIDEVHQLCRAVDNLPLAIEMAATRTRMLQVSELLARIEDRFATLASEMRSELSNHRTLRGTIEWSYDRLTPAERAVFERLAMLPAGCTLLTAEAVAWVDGDEFSRGDVVQLIGQLVDRSMLVADQRSTPTRFRMLDTIRQFGRERFAVSPTAPSATAAMVDWAMRTVIAAYDDSLGAEPDRARLTMEAEIDNIRVAFELALQAELPEALELANWIAYLRMNRAELSIALDWIRRAMPLGGEVAPDSAIAASRAYAEIWIRHSSHMLGAPLPDATDAIDSALDTLRPTSDGERLGSALLLAVSHAIDLAGDPVRALRLTDEIRERFDETTDPLVVARSDAAAAFAHLRLGDIERARALGASSIEALLALPSEVAAMYPMRRSILIAWRLGDHRTVRELSERLAQIEARYTTTSQYAGRFWLAALATMSGDPAAVKMIDADLARPALPMWRVSWIALEGMLRRRRGEVEEAARLLRDATPAGFQPFTAEQCMALAERGWCELGLGDLTAAGHFFDEALAFGRRAYDPVSEASGLDGAAAVALARGDRAEAVRLLAAADETRRTAPAVTNLHAIEVDELRVRLSG